MARTKGTVFVALKSFVTRMYGYDAWKQYLAQLEVSDRRQIEMPSAKEWYDLGVMLRSLQILDVVFGKDSGDVVYDFGRHEADRDLNTLQRVFLRMANPAFVIEKATEYWRNFCDFGEWRVERNGKKTATAILLGVPVTDPVYCRELSGYLQRLFELVGAKNVHSEHTRCRSRGDAQCEWVGKWE